MNDLLICMTSIPQLYVEGGALGMSMITVCLVGMLFAAWKAPNWVKEIGIAALLIGIYWQWLGLYQACEQIQEAGGIGLCVLVGGLKCRCCYYLQGQLYSYR